MSWINMGQHWSTSPEMIANAAWFTGYFAFPWRFTIWPMLCRICSGDLGSNMKRCPELAIWCTIMHSYTAQRSVSLRVSKWWIPMDTLAFPSSSEIRIRCMAIMAWSAFIETSHTFQMNIIFLLRFPLVLILQSLTTDGCASIEHPTDVRSPWQPSPHPRWSDKIQPHSRRKLGILIGKSNMAAAFLMFSLYLGDQIQDVQQHATAIVWPKVSSGWHSATMWFDGRVDHGGPKHRHNWSYLHGMFTTKFTKSSDFQRHPHMFTMITIRISIPMISPCILSQSGWS